MIVNRSTKKKTPTNIGSDIGRTSLQNSTVCCTILLHRYIFENNVDIAFGERFGFSTLQSSTGFSFEVLLFVSVYVV